jgi:hypothetical protein
MYVVFPPLVWVSNPAPPEIKGAFCAIEERPDATNIATMKPQRQCRDILAATGLVL